MYDSSISRCCSLDRKDFVKFLRILIHSTFKLETLYQLCFPQNQFWNFNKTLCSPPNCPDDLLFGYSAIFILPDMCMGSVQLNLTSTNFLSFKKRARSLINLFCSQPCSCYSFFHESKDLTFKYDLFRYLSEFDA